VRRHRGTDAGAAALETAVLFPALLLIILGTVQGGLWYHARQVALAAAQEGVRSGRSVTADPGDAAGTARGFARDQGRGLFADATATDLSSAREVRVRVSGRTLSLVPELTIAVSQEAAGTRERLTGPGVP
jgi:Flp pilus assembly protein TadG